MKAATFAAIAALALSAAPTMAVAMTVQEFLTTANRIPRNPTALLRSDARRLMSEINGAFKSVRDDQAAATAAGRRGATCIPAGTKISVSPDMILNRFNAIPAHRRSISVTQAVREWMAEEHPCPA
ncbi:hypothetical protein D8I30_00185 [Brevundimonas naejangsanensis]|uniref:Rap1a immunity protein domain-containing protein n=1 Tax=Brevundimonas naejangsanensis TaxID=588932 RepID=A0A494REF6_9CAUL|nr:hypothetical protein [Brevundimonas naejangsanensis]AYG93769.1 hypothetical protein D8I30_00185 [Brevundimonas naejangsanensis]